MSDNTLPSLAPRTFEDAIKFSEMLAKSDFVPKVFQNKPGDILAAIQMGYEVGLSPMAALSNIAVINGRPSIWGDAMLAVVQASGLLVHHKEYTEPDGTAVCEVGRKGDMDQRTGKQYIHVVKFGDKDAQKAQLLNKSGPWQQYPARMKMWRARTAFRDKFSDVLKGLIAREEALDIMPEAQLPSGELTEDETPRAEPRLEVVPDETEQPDADALDGRDVPAADLDETAIPEVENRLLTPDEVKEITRAFNAAPGIVKDKFAKVRAKCSWYTTPKAMTVAQAKLFLEALE